MGTIRVLRALAVFGVLSQASTLDAQTFPTGKDPRNGLRAGKGAEAQEAAHGMKLLSLTPKAGVFDTAKIGDLSFANSDLAFKGNYIYQGNFSGFSIWEVSDPAKPVLQSTVVCPTSQGDPSIYGNLLFISAEGGSNRKDCAKGGIQDTTDHTSHMAGVRIFDVSNPKAPRLVKNVETCKGSHTHTLIPSKKDKNILYIYVSGSGNARPSAEVAGCKDLGNDPKAIADPTNSMYRLDVIKVPLNKPESSYVVTGARIFTGLNPAPTAAGAPAGGRGGRGGAETAPPSVPPPSSRNCHDVTTYPELDLLAGACGSYGILVDIKNPEKPVRLDFATDTLFSLWHTAVFSNDGKTVVFSDEFGGGTQPRCQASTMMEKGGNTILEITPQRKFKKRGYFKIPSAQTEQENCVSHNGGLIPVPGRNVMVQAWYQGGVDVIDFTNPDKPVEIAYFDRGPLDNPPPIDQGPTGAAAGAAAGGAAGGGRGGRGGRGGSTTGGSWGAYYFNGRVYSSEIARGLDIMELTPTDKLSANEIAAAKLVTWVEYNPQSQPKIEWPAAFPVVRSYVDQLQRDNGLAAARVATINTLLDAAEKQTGAARKASLMKLALEVDKDITSARDKVKTRTLASEIRRLASVTR